MAGKRRKVAAHVIRNAATGDEMRQAVVELCDGVVTGCHVFVAEEPMTEWLGGTITLRRDCQGRLQAWWEGRPLGA